MRTVVQILQEVRVGKLSVKKAENLLKLNALAVIGDFAKLDYNRFLRRGVPEIVYSQNKTVTQLDSIISRLAKIRMKSGQIGLPIILSRITESQAKSVMEHFSQSMEINSTLRIRYFLEANMIAVTSKIGTSPAENGKVVLLAAGTSDITALNESEVVLNLLGCRTMRFNDVGVAALHRLLGPIRQIHEFNPDVIIVAAGMEGALPSVVAGLTSVPIIGLPTSVGYGYGQDGEAALMSMLQACSLGVSVVNIDSGVGAAVVAWLITSRVRSSRGKKVIDSSRHKI